MSLTEKPFFPPPAAPPRRPFGQRLLIGLFGLFVSGILALAVVTLVLLPTLPSVSELNESALKVPLRVYSADGVLMAEFGDEKRIPVRIDEVPEVLVHAILAAEDASFYFHRGVDIPGIVRAALSNLRAGRASEGASTITMQVARNFFLTPEKTFTRKLKEVLLAFKIERELSKNQILELYINKIFLGNRAYGFAAAAQIYYGKTLAELTLPEAATLAGLPKAPSRTNPLNNPDIALERRAYVLRRMLKLGAIDQSAFEQAVAAPLTASRHVVRYEVEAPYVAEIVRQHMIRTYADKTYAGGYHVYTTVRADLQAAANAALRKGLFDYDRRHGYRGAAGHVRLRRDRERGQLDEILKDYQAIAQLQPAIVTAVRERSLQAYTQDGYRVEVDWDGLAWARPHVGDDSLGPAPRTAAEVAREGDVVYLELLEDGKWRLSQVPEVSGALVSLSTRDGAILALAGGLDFAQNSFNHVTQAERQPGSNIKPFIYAAALDKGFTPATTVSGAPIVVQDVSLEEEWRPEDYSRQFFGPTRLRKALTLSLNLVAVRLLRAIGPEYANGYLAHFGLDPQKFPASLSLALGAGAASPLTMATAFGVFATGGYRLEPYLIGRVEDAHHQVLEQANPVIVCPDCPVESGPEPAGAKSTAPMQQARPGTDPANSAPPQPRYAERVLPAANAFIMTSIMRDVITSGTGTGARVLERHDLAGKTGTTNDHRDAWFSGFNADVVTTAWIGFDQPAPLGRGETGGRAALPMWVDFMREALRGVPEKPLNPPEGVVTAFVNSETGQPAAKEDPDAIEEYFLEGTVPGERVEAGGEPGTSVPPPPPPPENIRDRLF